MPNQPNESLVNEERDPLIRYLNKAVVIGVKFLAIFMVIVIWWSLIDVVVHVFQVIFSLSSFSVEGLISILGDFLVVLIAIEVFLNIIFYLKKDAVHVPLVLATALTAAARKVIILDYSSASYHQIYATAGVIIALGITYWLVTKKS